MDLPCLNDRYGASFPPPAFLTARVRLLTRVPGQYRYWGDHSKKGHAGTAIFSKIKPLNVTRGFQASEEVSAADSEGRMVTLEFDNSYLIGTCKSSLLKQDRTGRVRDFEVD